jgi:HAD superfamily 5'-nucleotidase-like hydrolase
VGSLQFDAHLVCRGLIIDTERGNLLKANRFGFIKHVMHGTAALNFDEQRKSYSRTIVDLAERRWIFLNTLFSLSEGCMYAQLVDLLDQRMIPEVLGYADLYEKVRSVLELAHMEGRLKAEIIAHPDRFVVLDPEVPLALLDQYHSGKKLMLITNSEWHYTLAMMNYTINPFLPKGMVWQNLFDLIVVGARKPSFFTNYQPFFEVMGNTELLKPVTGPLLKGNAYLGGSAHQVEKYLGVSGDEILYVGDHMFGDVHVTKNVLRWRTALILRELEDEVQSIQSFRHLEVKLHQMMEEKEQLEIQFFQIRLSLQRLKNQYAPVDGLVNEPDDKNAELEKKMDKLRAQLEELDKKMAPLAKSSAELSNSNWGLLLRAGNDKSYLAYQLERYADIYTSRVSNFLFSTPYAYFRSPRGSLPHDPAAGSFPSNMN